MTTSDISSLIEERAKLIATLSEVNLSIQTIIKTSEIIDIDKDNYIAERGGDIKYLDIYYKNSNNEKNNDIIVEKQKNEFPLLDKDKTNSEENKNKNRRENRKRITDYDVITDADVFSTTRKCKPIDKSSFGLGGNAEQVSEECDVR